MKVIHSQKLMHVANTFMFVIGSKMMDLLMDITDLTYYVTWGPGDSHMPADPESRLGMHRTVTRPLADSEDGQAFVDYIRDAVVYGQDRGYFTL